MRHSRAILVLACCVTACSPLRGVAPTSSSSAANVTAAAAPTPRGQACFACIQHPAIDAWERRLRAETRYRVTTTRNVERGAPYLERVRQIFVDAEMPRDLALLPVIESGFVPHARGAANCRGLWQLKPGTARRFGLRVDEVRDERLDPERATHAAAAYLRFLHDRYGDWPLALAAYNAGEGRVDRALARSPGSTVWELVAARHLPTASHQYISHFFAVVRVVDGAPSPS